MKAPSTGQIFSHRDGRIAMFDEVSYPFYNGPKSYVLRWLETEKKVAVPEKLFVKDWQRVYLERTGALLRAYPTRRTAAERKAEEDTFRESLLQASLR